MDTPASFPYVDEEIAAKVLWKGKTALKLYRKANEDSCKAEAMQLLSEALVRRLSGVIVDKLGKVEFRPNLQPGERKAKGDVQLSNALQYHLEAAQKLRQFLS